MAHRRCEDEQLYESFETLGIPREVAGVYCEILSSGKISRDQLSPESEAAVDELESQGLLHVDMDSGGWKYILAVDPQLAISALYSRNTWRCVPEEGCVAGNDDDTAALDQMYKARDYLVMRLSNIYVRHHAEEDGTRAIPEGSASNAIVLSLKKARQEILGITAPPWLQNTALIWEVIKRRIRAGIPYRRLADEVTAVAFGYQINLRDTFEVGVRLSFLPGEELSEKFFVRDEKEVFVFHPGSPAGGFRLEMLQTSVPAMVRLYREKFDKLWGCSLPSDLVLDFLRELRVKYMERWFSVVPAQAQAVLEGLYDYGIFFRSNYARLDEQEAQHVLSELERAGAVMRFVDSGSGYLPNIIPEVREYIRSRVVVPF